MNGLGERPTVLVVDDDHLNRAVLAEMIAADCRVLVAADGTTALALAATGVDLVLLDVSMPSMDGYEVLRRLRADPHTADIDVIFITGRAAEHDEERGLRLGALDYVGKPFRPALVRARLRNHLQRIVERRHLERLAERDGLTGVYNRRHLDRSLAVACRRSARAGSSLAVAMIDVDHFKDYNDHYGHAAGDSALRQVADSIARFARRPEDTVARYGGEEFVLLLPDTGQIGALAGELVRAVVDLDLPHVRSPVADGRVSVSVGAVVASGSVDPGALMRRADMYLYQAKERGRNRAIAGRWNIAAETLRPGVPHGRV